MTYRLLLFLILNFASVGLGRFLGGEGPKSAWYLGMNTAPWTPPGFVIGICWTILLICFSIYLTSLWPVVTNKKVLLSLLIAYYILSLIWNPIFFQYQNVAVALFVMTVLSLIVGFMTFYYWPVLKWKSFLVLPYFLWLVYAASLNLYVLMRN